MSAAVLGAALVGLWFLVVRPLRRASASESFRRRFQEALDMADTEAEALEVAGRALASSARRMPVELLLADSSQAHLYRAVVSGPDPAGPGCPVDAPRGCAAVRRGQTTTFPSSEDVGACPRLRDRPSGACSAVCTPVAILGRTIGVLHATGPEGQPPSEQQRDLLETTASQVGSRLGVIRAMSQSQLQASTDPLTGLLNRRSLEDRVRDLRRTGTPFVVAMADLDHFKALNDSFGHETGDRALRVFSRALAETVRAEDVVARHGGEEFVIVFPRCSVREAAEVLERVRERLRAALSAAEVPEFTCSAGVAEAGPEETFHDVLRAADEALLAAKRSGRDRVLISSSIRG
ncbi:MAG: GGDEF domain-containing protein [Thermoleophilia bacterium]|nr:GGDEF domain-containing protein [Thermoleophilia bacterium]